MAQSNTGSDWNWFLIFLIFVVVLAVALIIQARFSRSTANQFDTHPEEDHHEPAEAAPPTPAQPEPEPEPQAEPEPAAPAEPDDLKKLEGIGPKVAGLLNQNGITSFAQLAATPVEELEKILDANKLQMMHPGSWPQQAKLAADGNWEALQTMQDELKGGR
jgi:predicted flap endonuclease-1-like 5' DNA nuclease